MKIKKTKQQLTIDKQIIIMMMIMMMMTLTMMILLLVLLLQYNDDDDDDDDDIYQLSDDRITRETLSNNNPCPSSPSSTILRSAYMALNTLQQDWLL